ncbi:MAG TPA: hypothetical protein VIM03_06270 [Thermoleophilaceae bacterium]|jgi:hypothetical protein
MGRWTLLGVVLGLLFATAGCGGSKTFTVAPTQACLTQRGAKIGGQLDFVAQTATGGAFVAQLGDNFVKVVFGQTVTDGKNIEAAYQRFAFPNVRGGLPDVLRRDANVVMLWHQHPTDTDLALVTGCLK